MDCISTRMCRAAKLALAGVVALLTGCGPSAVDLGRIGLEQMQRILAEIGAIGARSFRETDPVALLCKVKGEPQYRFGSREEMVRYAEAPLGQAVPAASDGSSPGKYLNNTWRAEMQSRAGLEATAFHDRVLEDGALPLGRLSAKVERWIESSRP